MNKNIWLFGGVLVAVLVAGFFLMKKPATSPTLAPTSVATPSTEEVMDGETESVTEIEVSGKEFSFTPETISVKKGDKVRIVFKNEGTMTHDFVVEELNVRTEVIAPGETDTLTFTVPNDESALTFYCSVGAHRALGMEGAFEVE